MNRYRRRSALLLTAAMAWTSLGLVGCGGEDGASPKPADPTSPGPAPTPSALIEERLDDTSDARVQSDRYLLYLPPNYAADRSKRWPLVIYLHSNTDGKLDKTMDMLRNEGPFRWMKQTGRTLDAIMVAPLTAEARLLNRFGHNERFIDAVIREVQSEHAVDPERVSITGFSLGGMATWSMLLAHPHRFSAAAAVAGALYPERRNAWRTPDRVWGAAFASLRGNRIRVYHSATDEVVAYSAGKHPVELALAAGVGVTFIEQSGTHLESRTSAYASELLDWLIAQHRPNASAQPLPFDSSDVLRRYGARLVSSAGDGAGHILISDQPFSSYRHIGAHHFMLTGDDRRLDPWPPELLWFTPESANRAACAWSAQTLQNRGPWLLGGLTPNGDACVY